MKNAKQIEVANRVSNLSKVLKRVNRRWAEELGKPRNAALFIRSIADGGLQANKQIPLKCQTEELWDGDRLYQGSASVEGGRWFAYWERGGTPQTMLLLLLSHTCGAPLDWLSEPYASAVTPPLSPASLPLLHCTCSSKRAAITEPCPIT